jgi:hypothetical protein
MSTPAPCGLYAAPSPEGRTSFCGPTAIAAITGMAVGAVERLLVAQRKRHKPPCRVVLKGALVRTMWGTEVEPLARACGWNARLVVSPATTRDCRTFAQWRRGCDPAKRYLVLITGHFIAIHGDWLADTTHREPVQWSRLVKYRRGRMRVVRVWEMTPA